jgi:hypothetical protein
MISFSDERWPIVLVELTGEFTPEDATAMCDGLAVRYAKLVGDQRVGWLCTTKDLSGFGAAQRRTIADWMKANEEMLAKRNMGVAVVSTSTLVRGVFTAITWMVELPYEVKFVETHGEAERWLEERASSKPT